jgi:hypothetical protein
MRRKTWGCVAFSFVLTLATAAFAEGPTEEEITKSRERGIQFLKLKQKPDGSWDFAGHDIGITALCTIALIENGMPVTDPVIQRGYEFVKKGTANLKNTYDLALVATLLSRVGDRRDRPQIKALAARLIAGQMDSGGWHYNCPGQELDAEKVLRDPSALPKPKEGFGDNSCTQFAVLGLWVASRSGVNIDKTLAKVSQRFNKTQLEDGGWAYLNDVPGNALGARPPSSASMTGAGLFCLAVAEATQIREALKSGKRSETPGGVAGKALIDNKVFSKGLKRTGEFVKGMSAGSPRYFMWSVERIGVLLGLEQMGEVDWFQRGADALLKSQKEEGGWPTAWADADKNGLSDTAFALLFLRKANLGSDISRLLEGEHEQRFEILHRKPAARFDTLDEAVQAAKAGETIRINGPGPYKVGHLELSKDLVIQAGFGYSPIIKHEIGVNRLGIKLRPETDANARDMFTIAGGKVTLEGLRLQMDPPQYKKPVPWRAVTVKSGSLRLLNCTVSETNKQGTTGVIVETPGQTVIRNCLFVGGRAAVELAPSGSQELVFDNSICFSNAGIVLSSDAGDKSPFDLKLSLSNSVFQVKEVIVSPKLKGTVDVVSRLCVYQGDWLGSNFVAGASDVKGRSWKGSLNIYDVKQWIGASGKAAGNIKDVRAWIALWGNVESDSFNRIAPFVGLRQVGNFSHECSPQDWQLELPPDADALLQRARTGVNSFLAGPGVAFDQYRETIAYSDWLKGKLNLSSISNRPGRALIAGESASLAAE